MKPKLFSIVGRSNSGKTTLITRLIPFFVRHGLKVGTIKHTHHPVLLDQPGKDSWKHANAGSARVLLLSAGQMALFGEADDATRLLDISQRWFSGYDLVISEGFKNEDCLKIEITRKANGKPPLYLDPTYRIQAVVSDYPIATDLPVFGLDEPEPILQWLIATLEL
jgi:molybdopterin-guanine dinucleotide biosynthesis adapter protein